MFQFVLNRNHSCPSPPLLFPPHHFWLSLQLQWPLLMAWSIRRFSRSEHLVLRDQSYLCLLLSGGLASSSLICEIPDSFSCAHPWDLRSPWIGTCCFYRITVHLPFALWPTTLIHQQERLWNSCNCTLIIKWIQSVEHCLLARNFSKSFPHTVVYTLHPMKCIVNVWSTNNKPH